MADSKNTPKRGSGKTDKSDQDDRTQAQKDRDEARDQQTVLEQHPDLDPNAPDIDEVERNRRREELTRLQG